MDLRQSKSPSLEQPSWLIPVVGGLALFAGFVIADGVRLGGLYVWTTISVLGCGLAVAIFWPSRTSKWFWPTIVLVAAAHSMLLWSLNWQAVPRSTTGSRNLLRAGIGVDFCVNCVILYIIRGLFGPEAKSQTGPEAVAKAIKLSFATLCLIIPIALALIVTHAPQT